MTKISTDPPAFHVRPVQPEEAGAFFAQTPEQDVQMGAIGHVRMDFGGNGKEFWHTWHPRGREELNTPEFKAELQQIVDKLRETVLKDISSMQRFCCENGGDIPGGWSQNYGYVVETEHYEYCLRCNPVKGDYQAYLSCYDLNEQKINHAYQPLIGRVHFSNGDAQQFTDAVAGIVIICCAAVPARTGAPMLTGRILFPTSIAIIVTAGVDRFAFRLAASTRIRTVSIAGTSCSLLALQHPCMAAAVRASAGAIGTRTVALIGVSAEVLNVMAGITLIIVGMTARRMCDFNVCALE